MKLRRIKSFTIRRSKWARGGKKGPASLLNDRGNMCCLGFCSRAARVPVSKLRNAYWPCSVDIDEPIPLLTDAGLHDTPLSEDAAIINDDKHITNRERERRLSALFATKGVKVRFVP